MYSYSGMQFVKPARRAVVIGGGFIGLETAENLIHAGFEVTLVEMLDQLLAPLDRELALLVEEHVKRHGLRLALDDGVAGFKQLRKRRARGADEIGQGRTRRTSSSSRSACVRTRRSPKPQV